MTVPVPGWKLYRLYARCTLGGSSTEVDGVIVLFTDKAQASRDGEVRLIRYPDIGNCWILYPNGRIEAWEKPTTSGFALPPESVFLNKEYNKLIPEVLSNYGLCIDKHDYVRVADTNHWPPVWAQQAVAEVKDGSR